RIAMVGQSLEQAGYLGSALSRSKYSSRAMRPGFELARHRDGQQESRSWLAPAREVNCKEDYWFSVRRIAPNAPTNPVPSSNRELGSGVVPRPGVPWISKAPSGFPVPLLFQTQPVPPPSWHPLVAYRSRPFTPWLFQFHASQVVLEPLIGPRSMKYDCPPVSVTPLMPVTVTRPQQPPKVWLLDRLPQEAPDTSVPG